MKQQRQSTPGRSCARADTWANSWRTLRALSSRAVPPARAATRAAQQRLGIAGAQRLHRGDEAGGQLRPGLRQARQHRQRIGVARILPQQSAIASVRLGQLRATDSSNCGSDDVLVGRARRRRQGGLDRHRQFGADRHVQGALQDDRAERRMEHGIAGRRVADDAAGNGMLRGGRGRRNAPAVGRARRRSRSIAAAPRSRWSARSAA